MDEKRTRMRALGLALLLIALLAGAALLYPRLAAQMQSPAATQTPAAQNTLAPGADDQSASPLPQQTQAEVAGPQARADLAPVFTAYDAQGRAVRLSDQRGMPVVVNFFASWCGPCQQEMAYFEEAFAQYGERVCFMMVDLCAYGNDSQDSVQAMIEEAGYTFPVYFDTDGEAVSAYAVRAIPTTVFIDAKGALIDRATGAMTREQLKENIEALLAEP